MEVRGTLNAVTRPPHALTAVSSGDIAAIVDPHFDAALDAGRAPGMAYGVLVNGDLVHTRGLGARVLPGGAAPDADTGFRIASMTKSFTAATVLCLRDAGALHLDASVAEFVPEFGGVDDVTIRHLLTMGGGFLTDDPWGDRQQDLSVPEFRRLVETGIRPAWAPGERFEYSNLGYALIGLVIEAVTGTAYVDAVQTHVLDPLALRSTGFAVSDISGPVSTGYVRRTAGWHEEPIAPSGAFSPMGGLLSTVNDLATWVALLQGVHAAEWSGPPEALGLGTQSLREMQVTQRLVAAQVSKEPGGAPDVTGYGFGLFEDFRSWGRSVYHSGGYPGFGSHMRWHPASGLGIVALANGTYAPMSTVGLAALRDLVLQLGAPVRQPPVDLPGLEVARSATTAWLTAGDPEGEEARVLRALFADNVERDVPWAERVTVWRSLRASEGVLRPTTTPATHPSPGSLSWQMTGEVSGNRHQVVVMVAPHDTRLVQSIEVKAVAEPALPPPVSADLR
jgi:CubicO group peptidase (beta-lactamase class C family)